MVGSSWFRTLAAGVAVLLAAAGADESDERRGTPEDRGSSGLIGLNKVRADEHGLEPVVEFLTYIQQQRGDDSHLLFVREQDIHQLALESGEEDAVVFLSRMDQLGVVISSN